MPARDPLYEQIALRVRARCLLIDVDWVYELVAGRTDEIDREIDGVLHREGEAHDRGERPTDAERDRYRFWTDALQLDLADARRAAVTFNSMDENDRRVFFALIIEERSIEECVEARLGDREALGRTVRSVFWAVLDVN